MCFGGEVFFAPASSGIINPDPLVDISKRMEE